MSDLDFLVDLHREGKRQGPGGEDETRLAITLSGLSGAQGLKIADIDPRGDPALCHEISDKALAIGGGVAEAVGWFFGHGRHRHDG